MKREEYLRELKLVLEEDNFGPVEEAISYFNELLEDRMMDEGLDEEAAVATMEAPREAARQLLHTRTAQEEQKQEAANAEEEPFKPGVRTIDVKAGLVKNIIIRDRNQRLIVRGWDKDSIVIHHPESKKIRYDVTLEDGALSLIRRPQEFQFFNFDVEVFDSKMREVTLDVPKELAAELNLRTSNGKLSVEQVNCWGVANLTTSNSALELRNYSAKDINAKSSNGSLTLTQVTSQKEIFAGTSNSKIRADQARANDKLTLKTSNGGIEVHGLFSPAISLTTSNANILGELPGIMSEYAITSGTSNSKNNLPKSQVGSSKTLSVFTSNAKIELDFENGQPTQQAQQDRPQDSEENMAEQIEAWAERTAQQAEVWAGRTANWAEEISQKLADKLSRAFDDKPRDPKDS